MQNVIESLKLEGVFVPAKVFTIKAKPFLKWAGGKGQLIDQIAAYLPEKLKSGKIKKYFEPFLGGGALYFWLAGEYEFKSVYLNEINPVIVNSYKVIRNKAKELEKELNLLQRDYVSGSLKEQEKMFYDKRAEFNMSLKAISKKTVSVNQASLLIFLNRTCFNGLYRVNSKGEFNVPFGRYLNPKICNKENIAAVHKYLQNAEITCEDFSVCLKVADENSFVYFDPPYRPISTTASFTSYTMGCFDDKEQHRLKKVFDELKSERHAFVMLSNSDPKNNNPKDNFFDDLYKKYKISRLNATRLINCNAERRGLIKEILVMSY